jgi:hypothetical protein
MGADIKGLLSIKPGPRNGFSPQDTVFPEPFLPIARPDNRVQEPTDLLSGKKATLPLTCF